MFIVKIFLPSVKIHKKALTSKEDLFVLFSRSPTETTNMAFTIVLKWLYLFQLECLIGICFSNESKSGYVSTLVAISYFIRK